jgi:hypothetical protein
LVDGAPSASKQALELVGRRRRRDLVAQLVGVLVKVLMNRLDIGEAQLGGVDHLVGRRLAVTIGGGGVVGERIARQLGEVLSHAVAIPLDEHVHRHHELLLGAKLDVVGEILQQLGDQRQIAARGGPGTRPLGSKP